MSIITKYLTTYTLDENNTLLINALSGALDIVNNEIRDNILEIKKTNSIKNIKDNDLLNSLKDRGYIFNSEEDEMNAFKNQKAIYDRFLRNESISFVICPTMGCNLRCTYCF